MATNYFTLLQADTLKVVIPDVLNDPFGTNIPAIALIAAKELQDYITKNQPFWEHNFGVEPHKTNLKKGKMFGVLVVENKANEIGYLSAFSGKLDGDDFNNIFVPSLFDTSIDDYFLDKGMSELTVLCNQIDELKTLENTEDKVEKLIEIRKNKSNALQQKIFDQYIFLNRKGDKKDLYAVFEEYSNKKPAGGSGECAAPKLLQYAFQNELKPLAIAEFWWGKTTPNRAHLNYYPSCNDKCKPILGYMLAD